MDRSEFAELALAQIKKARPTDASIVDEEKFIIVTTSTDGSSSITSLTNHYDEWVHAAPGAKQVVLERIARTARAIDGKESLDEIRVLLVPRIRPRRHFEIDLLALTKEIVSPKETKPTHYEPLAEHLGVGLAIDRPEHVEYVPDPARFGATGSELQAIALANLKRMTKRGPEEVRPGLWLGSWGDDYAGERMLVPELFSALPTKGDPVLFLPGSERVYVVGSEDAGALASVLELVDQRLAAPRGLLPFGFVLRDGAWRLFEGEGELGRELGRRLCLHLADAYAAQREMLQARYAEDEDGPFVAGVMGLRDEEDALRLTLTTWGKGIHTLLPRAQAIALGRTPEDVCMVPWEDVFALAGEHLVAVPGLYPPRWEIKSFPDEATLAKLEARRVDLHATKRPAPAPAPGPAVHANANATRPPPEIVRPRTSPAKIVLWLFVFGAAAIVIYALMR